MGDDRGEPGPRDVQKHPATFESRSWDDVVEFVRIVLRARSEPARGAEITDDLLAQLATEIATAADAMDGPMPDEIEVFVREFAPSR